MTNELRSIAKFMDTCASMSIDEWEDKWEQEHEFLDDLTREWYVNNSLGSDHCFPLEVGFVATSGVGNFNYRPQKGKFYIYEDESDHLVGEVPWEQEEQLIKWLKEGNELIRDIT